jgi:membrane-anchored mycosin MYCP
VHKRSTPGLRLVAGACGVLVAVLGSLAPAGAAHADDVQSKQWYLTTLHAKQAQKISTGKGVVVAVIDSGVQADHPDLAGQVLPGLNWPPGSAKHDKGWSDATGHGTAVAGIIAGIGGRDHLLGLAPGAKILPIEMAESLPVSTIGPAITWAVDHGAKVINLSVVAESDPPGIAGAVRYALAHDVVVVASAGNLPLDKTVHEPASIPGVLAVSGLDEHGKFWTGSTSGPEVAISAPATNIYLISNHQADGSPGGYATTPGGTSAAAPMVASAAALIRAKYPKMTAPDVINRLIRTADDAGPAGRDPQYGFGRLDIVKALTADVPSVGPVNPLGAPAASAAPQASGITDRLGKLPLGAVAALAGLVLVVLVAVVVAILIGRRRARSR